MLLNGCSNNDNGCSHIEEHGEVVVEISEQSSLLFYNNTECTVRYYVGDSEVLARITPGPYQFYESWPTIPAGQVKEVPFEKINYYSTSTRNLWIGWNYLNKSAESTILIWFTLSESDE